jgi:hypothetical protein
MGCFRPSKSTRMVDGPFLRKMTPLPFLSLGQRSFPRTERRTRMPWRISMSSLFIGPPRWIELEQSRLRKKISGQPDVIVSSRTNAKFPIVVSRMYAGDDPMAPALMPGFFVLGRPPSNRQVPRAYCAHAKGRRSMPALFCGISADRACLYER